MKNENQNLKPNEKTKLLAMNIYQIIKEFGLIPEFKNPDKEKVKDFKVILEFENYDFPHPRTSIELDLTDF